MDRKKGLKNTEKGKENIKAYFPHQEILDNFQNDTIQKMLNQLLEKYQEILKYFIIEDFQSVLVQIGKFDELFYRFLDYLARGTTSKKIVFDKIDERLEIKISKGEIPSSLLSLIAKSLRLSYKFRNSRDGAHVNDFIANKIDAIFVINNAQWCIAELVRNFSTISMEECLVLINGIMDFPTPVVQRFDNILVVLDDMSASKEILTILYYWPNNHLKEIKLKKMIVNHSSHSQQNVSTSLNNLVQQKLIFKNNGILYLTGKGKKDIRAFLSKRK